MFLDHKMKFGLVYDSNYCHITGQFFRQSLRKADTIHFDLSVYKSDADIRQLLDRASEWGGAPDVILHETGAPGLLRGLESVCTPTACLDIDTFGWTQLRVRWAMLFDYVFTWHPSYVRLFQEAGHPRVLAIPHAVDARFFSEIPVTSERRYDLGFVGNSGLPQYRQRDRIMSTLAARFKMNDFARRCEKDEMAEVYQQSRIAVNVSRAEFPAEANMRCYEAMAGGALLMTAIPTELTEWGFVEGEHFIGWRSEDEIPGLVARFLGCTDSRLAIARAGQARTLKDFTYQRCAEMMVDTIERDEGRLFAPAREWPPEKVHLLYLSYYDRFGLPCAALEEFRRLRKTNPSAYWRGLPMVLKTLRRTVMQSLK
jgi:hypothetical protein